MPKKKIDHYLYTGERYIAVYEDGSSEPVDESEAVDEIITDGTQLEIEGVTISGEKSSDQPNWFQNAWAQGDSAKNEQARQSWDDYMPKNYTDYSQYNSNPYQQQSNQPRYNPKVLQSKAIEPRFEWQRLPPIQSPETYDGPQYDRDARIGAKKLNDTNAQYFPNAIQIGAHKNGFHPTGDEVKYGDIKEGTAIPTNNPELLALSHLTDDELIYHYYHANQQAASFSPNRPLNQEFKNKILFRFINGSGGTFTDMPLISKAIWSSTLGIQTQNEISREFKHQMKANGGNFNGIFSNFSINLSSPNYRNSCIILRAIAGGTQQLDVELNSIKFTGRFYTATVTATIWDNYGVDEKDAIIARGFKAEIAGARLGLQAMWILQNQRGKKPLKLGYKHTFTVAGFY